MSRKAFKKLGAPRVTVPAEIKCDLANNQRIKIKEATWLKITTADGGVKRKTRQRVYIMDTDIDMYLSYEALTILGQIRRNWDDDGNRRERTAAAAAADAAAAAVQAAGEDGATPSAHAAVAAT